MQELSMKLSSKNQVTVPLEVRRELRIGPHDRMSFVIDKGVITVRPAAFTLESVFGSAPPLGDGGDIDFRRIAEEAWEDQVGAPVARDDAH